MTSSHGPADLSPREEEVLALVAAGRTNPQIADALVISPGTVNRHVHNILTKLRLSNRTEAATFVASRSDRSASAKHHAPAVALPFPAGLRPSAASAFVGRADALAQLRAAGVAASRGERRVVLIAGEPGIGKTRLAAEFALEAHAAGATVLFGRCDEEDSVPYQPFVEAINAYAAAADVDSFKRTVGRAAPEIAQIAPQACERLGDLGGPTPRDPASQRYRLFEALAGWLENVAESAGAGDEAPGLVLVLDDLHWADKPTLLALRHLARRTEPANLLVIGTYRETELGRTHPLMEVLADLRREPCHGRLVLRGLDISEVGDLLRAAAPHAESAGAAALRTALLAETEGNPFFLEEVIRHLKETGALHIEDGLWRSEATSIAELGIPEGVREVVGRRLARLSDACNVALTRASVLGREFDLGLLATLAGEDANRLLDSLDEAVGVRLVEEVAGAADRFRFAHAIVRQTLYAEIPTSRRVRFHRQAGEAIEGLGAAAVAGRVNELAVHFWEALSAEVAEKALEYSRRAAGAAAEVHAFEVAVLWYRRALEALDLVEAGTATGRDAERFDLLMALAKCEEFNDDWHLAAATFVRAMDVARGLADARRFASALRAYYFGPGQYDEEASTPVARWHAEALALATDPELQCELLFHTTHLVFGLDMEARRDALITLRSVATEIGTPASTAMALVAEGWMIAMHDERPEDALPKALEAFALAPRGTEPWMRARGLSWNVAARLGDLGEIQRLQAAQWQPSFENPGRDLQRAAGLAIWTGELSEAARLAREALAYAERWGITHDRNSAGYQRFVVDWLLEPPRPADASWRTQPAWGHRQVEHITAWMAGDLEAAREIRRAIPREPESLRGFAYLVTMAEVAWCDAKMKERDGASELYRLLLPHRRLSAGFRNASWGSVSRYLGLLAQLLDRPDDAVAHYEDAVEANTRFQHRPMLALTCADFAETLIARDAPGDRERAREQASLALADAQAMGMQPCAAQARAVLAQLGP